MGNIGHQVPAHLLVAFQGAGQLVKIFGQTPQLIAAGGGDAGGEIAGRQTVRPLNQAFNRREQTARQREGGQRRQQRGEGDNQPAGTFLLAVKVDIGVARQAFNRRGDDRANLDAVDHNTAPGTVLRHAFARAHQYASFLIDHPEHRAPAVRRHIGAGTAVATIAAWTVERPVRRGVRRHLFRAGTTVRLIHRTAAHTAARRRAVIVVAFKGFQQLENKAVVVAQKRPAAVLGILLAQGIAEHGQALFVAALDIVNKAAFKADTHRPVHADQQHDAGGEDRDKQLAGNAGTPELQDSLLLRRRITVLVVVSSGTREKISAGSAIITAMLK